MISPMEWKFFFGACFLTGAMLTPLAGLKPVTIGMVLAAAILWAWSVSKRRP
jgi:hypothetical protein